jgi:glutathione peroxidase
MNALIQKLGETGAGRLVILGFPCNQFGLQEPGKNKEILNILRHVRPGNNYIPKFALSKKIDVNGKDEHPLYTLLKDACPGTKEIIGERKSLFWDPIRQSDITWNFEKFLVTKDGKPYKRYSPSVEPLELETDIRTLLAQDLEETDAEDNQKNKAQKSKVSINLQQTNVYSETILNILSKVLNEKSNENS